MQNTKIVYLNLIIISASVICFEIISTRISSVVFVNNYAFIILSLAILGLGCGGIFSYYKIKKKGSHELFKFFAKTITLIGISFSFFIVAVIKLDITNPFIYFLLLFLPFFFAGIIYAQLFKLYAEHSFKLYASDLSGAAIGSVGSIGIFSLFTAPNAILFLSIVIFCSALSFSIPSFKKTKIISLYSFLILSVILLLFNGTAEILGKVPIGKFSEKDFYYVYPDAASISQIIDSRWSIHGRSDLVQYNNQDMVKQLFIDGAAGTQMYRFGGDIRNPDNLLYNLLIRHTSSIPFSFLTSSEKNNMLVIGPGGGKEVLIGLLGGVEQITGVEINPDFVNIVKKYKNFNGGIYTDFPNVNILVQEGRHYIKQTDQQFDLVVMALPSTEQLQNIDNFAMSENYLLTVEAIQDYLKILTPEGRLIFTVHNRWELMRLIITSMAAFNGIGINNQEALDHFEILEQDYAPTIVIKKNIFTKQEITYTENIIKSIPKELPSVTYLPYHWGELGFSIVNQLLTVVKENRIPIQEYIEQHEYNISPCRDDSPYFYKVKKGVPEEYLWLLIGIAVLDLFIIGIPFSRIKKKIKKNKIYPLTLPLIIFIGIGAGFMILEVSLFQKLILYLGSPTTSLAVLLGSILIGMGTGSFFGGKIFKDELRKRLYFTFISIIVTGILLFTIYPYILNSLLEYSLTIRSVACFSMILPFGFLLGIPFPSAIQLLKQENMENCIPWMYGINGAMSVLGSVIAVILSMIFGFTLSFFVGLSIYFIVFLILITKPFSIQYK